MRIAAVSAQSQRGMLEKENIGRALAYIDEAAAMGAQFVCFPEGYPGPYSGPADYSPLDRLCERAAHHRLYVIASLVEFADDLGPAIYRLALKLIGPRGSVEGTYTRVLPNPREMNDFLMGGKTIAPGDELPVFETEHGVIGLLICSEIWSPELPLILALKGADIIFAPIGGAVYELYENWKTVLRARACENTVYVATCQNVWGMEAAMGLITGPDGIVAESTDPGVLLGDVDLDRLKWLRSQTQELVIPKPYRSIPGMLRHRRPELYGLIGETQGDRYDFWYFNKRGTGVQG